MGARNASCAFESVKPTRCLLRIRYVELKLSLSRRGHHQSDARSVRKKEKNAGAGKMPVVLTHFRTGPGWRTPVPCYSQRGVDAGAYSRRGAGSSNRRVDRDSAETIKVQSED